MPLIPILQNTRINNLPLYQDNKQYKPLKTKKHDNTYFNSAIKSYTKPNFKSFIFNPDNGHSYIFKLFYIAKRVKLPSH